MARQSLVVDAHAHARIDSATAKPLEAFAFEGRVRVCVQRRVHTNNQTSTTHNRTTEDGGGDASNVNDADDGEWSDAGVAAFWAAAHTELEPLRRFFGDPRIPLSSPRAATAADVAVHGENTTVAAASGGGVVFDTYASRLRRVDCAARWTLSAQARAECRVTVRTRACVAISFPPPSVARAKRLPATRRAASRLQLLRLAAAAVAANARWRGRR